MHENMRGVLLHLRIDLKTRGKELETMQGIIKV